MKWVLISLLGVALGSSYAATPVRSKPSSKPSSAIKAKPTVTTSKRAASGHIARARYTRKKRAVRGPSFQLHPDPDRYQEIQKALADRGYFKGEVNGQWGGDSVDALKRFQADQKLGDDGKISALTLIGLGLGPKHDGSAVSMVTPAPASAAESPSSPPGRN